ncbi:MAG TPA: formylglycine-generating enzyme family protein [Bacteroidales bacterium]|nr:formylglycine-generating enzyme family protein [Bacteroidales bacterium]HRZ76508.1 formylglycine-generating enzyme family protein [Bacteroidales bacterium]
MSHRLAHLGLALILALAAHGQQRPGARQMVRVQGGAYLPLYSGKTGKTEVKAFEMDIFPVTNADFLRFVQDYPEWSRSRIKPLFADSNYLRHWQGDLAFDPAIARSPVVNISWFAAKKYCECQGKRLPETAEWEVAAKASQTQADAGSDPAYYQYVLNWLTKPSPAVLPRVGSTFRNYFGVYDLHGLVWEWTWDFNSALSTGESRGNASLDNTLFCGGGALGSGNMTNYASFMRFAMRSSMKAKYCVPNLGFRCVK